LKYNRFIALGDSFTEGMCDEKKYGQYRGWADRVADVMAANQPGFQYANLSIRGKLLKQVIDEQLEPALAQVIDKTTLVSFHAGANDVIRPKYNPNITLPLYAEAARKVAAAFKDPRFLAFDRLHLNPMGHDRVAQAVLERIELPFDPTWRHPLPPQEPTGKVMKAFITAAWFATFALPWMWRRARGKSSGDGRTCKYPHAINWPLSHLD